MNKKQLIPLTSSLSLLLTACGNNDMTDLEQYIVSVKARPAGIVEPIPELRPYHSFQYPDHDKDPFDSTELRPKKRPVFKQGVTIDHNRVPEFLEGFPLDSFTMVGTVKQKGIQWGLVKIPDGTVHRVKVGNYIGQNYGKVVAIEEGKIILKEIIPNGFGGYKERDNAISLSSVVTQ